MNREETTTTIGGTFEISFGAYTVKTVSATRIAIAKSSFICVIFPPRKKGTSLIKKGDVLNFLIFHTLQQTARTTGNYMPAGISFIPQ